MLLPEPIRPTTDTVQSADPTLPRLLSTAALGRAELVAGLSSGDLVKVRRGRVVDLRDDAGATVSMARRRHQMVLARALAFADEATTPFWFSHATAAVLWGCWTYRLRDEAEITQLTNPSIIRRDGDRVHRVRRHWTALPVRDQMVLRGVPITTLERTVVDCARGLSGPQGLVVADSALRLGARTDLMERVLQESAGKRGVRRARRILEVADARSESPGESIVRWHAQDAGLPAPELQVRVATWLGEFWMDLGWSDVMVGIEFDGAVKYAELAGADPAGALMREKRRHDAIIEAGWTIVRVTWADLAEPERLVARLRAARSRAWWRAK